MPDSAAGWRIEPPVSVPRAQGTKPAATAAAEPPLDSELDPADLAALRQAGRAVRVSKNLHYHPETLAQILQSMDEATAHELGRIDDLQAQARRASVARSHALEPRHVEADDGFLVIGDHGHAHLTRPLDHFLGGLTIN